MTHEHGTTVCLSIDMGNLEVQIQKLHPFAPQNFQLELPEVGKSSKSSNMMVSESNSSIFHGHQCFPWVLLSKFLLDFHDFLLKTDPGHAQMEHDIDPVGGRLVLFRSRDTWRLYWFGHRLNGKADGFDFFHRCTQMYTYMYIHTFYIMIYYIHI